MCWRSLLNLKDLEFSTNCINFGDFNVTLNSLEKRGGSFSRDPFGEKLEEMIGDWSLLDNKPTKGKYTWSNRRVRRGHIAARLEDFLDHNDILS